MKSENLLWPTQTCEHMSITSSFYLLVFSPIHLKFFLYYWLLNEFKIFFKKGQKSKYNISVLNIMAVLIYLLVYF